MATSVRRMSAALALIAALSTVGACSQASSPARPAAAPTKAAAAGVAFDQADPKTWTLPMEAYLPTDAENRQLGRASAALMESCMHKAGFTAWQPAPDLPKLGPKTLTDWRYGIHEKALSSKRGYHTDAAEQEAYDVAMQAGALDGTTPENAQTRSSCADKTVGALGRTGKTYGELAQQLGNDAYLRAKQEPEVVAAFKQWSDCMKESGYSYKEPMDANDDQRFSGRDVSREEIATALADLGCRSRTQVALVWYRAEVGLQQAALEQNAQALRAERQELDAVVKKAAGVLADAR
ncbi:hypothetical protein CFP65_3810 [Kitasatospora sp. MMS16-BH015]|uniref:hypothetical protein n=1 Tax=Kitasatospora sp. MMS16-BH015 TaxID=2018025 RepID=UPI000CA3ADD9|nr:hypothetical protein [Kitasatospora sp. MMS16-BH015]AUG78590.1 hypothetical protein CFP65_3810 [Kitasatospora sp. MMS16-BH015]